MKKVFLLAAFVFAFGTGGFASENGEASLSEMPPVKKTTKNTTSTKKKTTSTKSTTAKSTTAKSTTTKSTTTKSTVASMTSTPSTASTATIGSDATTSKIASTASSVAGILGGLLGAGSSSNSAGSSSNSTVGNIIGGLLNNVIGSGTFSQTDLCSQTWKYSKPGCAFTSENLLAKAGGEVVANKIENQLSTYYSKAGFSSTNTYFKFNEDGSFESKIKGKTWKGTYTFDEKTHAIQLKSLILLNLSGYATKTTNGISLLFESKKLLSLVQTLSALSGNSTLSAIGNITKSYDGVRIGFEMTK